MNPSIFTPLDLGTMPSRAEFPSIAYNWERQARIVDQDILNSKQTFDFNGNPKDTTSGSGNTAQTFDFNGKPKDCKAD